MAFDAKAWLRREFLFTGLKTKDFVVGIFENRQAFFVLQLVLAVFWFSLWNVSINEFYGRNNQTYEYSDFLSYWTETLITMHMMLSVIICALYINSDDLELEKPAKWFCYVSQLLYSYCTPISFFITGAQYGLLAGESHGLYFLSDKYTHAWNVVIMGLQLILIKVPIRFGHFIFSMLLLSLYILNSYIAFTIDPARDDTYPFINWAKGQGDFPISTKITIIALLFIGTPIFHWIFYGLSLVKFSIKDYCVKPKAAYDEFEIEANCQIAKEEAQADEVVEADGSLSQEIKTADDCLETVVISENEIKQAPAETNEKELTLTAIIPV